jgi:hypothetical protein
MVADVERREINQANLIRQHPELLSVIAGGKRGKR